MTTALEGIRVLDLSRILAGPFCAMVLADLGAEVIKVESPAGDDSRMFGPMVEGESAYYRLFNRGKLGITLDFKDPGDRAVLLDLVRRCDVVIENFRPGVLDRLGLSPRAMLEANPRLVIASITGFGQEGPFRDAPAYDLVAQAMSGIMSVTGAWGGSPTRVGLSIGDLVPGLYGVIGILGALHERARTGRGQHVDIAMVDSLISILESVAMRALHGGERPAPTGNDHAMTAPFSTYATADEPIAIAVSNDRLFGDLARALGRPQWLEDERFGPYAARHEHREALRVVIEEALGELTAEQAVAHLAEHGVPASRVLSVNDALTHPNTVARGMVRSESDGFLTLASPVRLTGSVVGAPAPTQGQHQDLIEQWLAEPERVDGPSSSPPHATTEGVGDGLLTD